MVWQFFGFGYSFVTGLVLEDGCWFFQLGLILVFEVLDLDRFLKVVDFVDSLKVCFGYGS